MIMLPPDKSFNVSGKQSSSSNPNFLSFGLHTAGICHLIPRCKLLFTDGSGKHDG
jgi:hypothetical protein